MTTPFHVKMVLMKSRRSKNVFEGETGVTPHLSLNVEVGSDCDVKKPERHPGDGEEHIIYVRTD